MKLKIIIAVLFLMNSLFCMGQEKPVIPAAPEDKAVVYFVRTSSLGAAINFTYFDSSTLIGRSNGTNFIRYECSPGHHLFWARSENKDFLEAELEAGKIYFIQAVPQMGAFKAGVNLLSIDPSEEKIMKRVHKLMDKKEPVVFSPEELEKETKKFNEVIERGLEIYKEEKAKGKKMATLEKNQYHNN